MSNKLTVKQLTDLDYAKSLAYVRFTIRVPKHINSDEDLKKWMDDTFILDIDMNDDSDFRDHIFYNADLRSMCGYFIEFGCNEAEFDLNLHTFIGGFETEFQNLLKHTTHVEFV